VESSSGFAGRLQGSTKPELHSWKNGVDEEVAAGLLMIALRGMITHYGVFHLFNTLSTCLKSTLPLEKAEAHFWLPKLQKEQKALITETVMVSPGVADPRPALQIPLRVATMDHHVYLEDHPDLKDNPDLKETPDLKEDQDLEENPDLKDYPDLKETPDLKDNPDLEDHADLQGRPDLEDDPDLEDHANLEDHAADQKLDQLIPAQNGAAVK
jgi:hypothetical protein